MESNKEDAILAMDIAVKRLHDRDYAGAKRIALKAEKLFPQLDNISQLLAVCEVHSSAQKMGNGLYDWYKIIQVDPVSDELHIRKQYRKLAFLLHPDKNKFPGAEAAFKLVGEANNTLSDRAKRTMYDIKRRHLVSWPGSEHNTQAKAAKNSSSSSVNRGKQQKSRQPPQPQPQGFTFWTACPRCDTRLQCNRNILSMTVQCSCCSSKFKASVLPHLNQGHMSGVVKQPQQFPGQQPQTSGFYRPPMKPENNFNPKPTVSISSGLNTVTGQRKTVTADTNKPTADPFQNQYPKGSCQHKFNSDVDTDQTHDGACAVRNSMLFRRSRDKSDVKNNGTDTGVLSPAKKARVMVNEEQDDNDGMVASNTGTKARTSVEMELKEQDKEEGKAPSVSDRDQTHGGAHAVRNRTPLKRTHNKPDVKNNSTDADVLNPPKKARVEVNGEQGGNGGNGGMDASHTVTKVSIIYKLVVKELNKEKGKEQVEPSMSDMDQTNGGGHAVRTSMPLRRSLRNKPDVKSNGTDADILSPALKERVELKGAQNVTDASRRFTKSNTPVEREVKEQNKEKVKEQVEPSMSDMDQTNGGGHAVCTSMPLRRSLRNKPDVKSNGTDADILSPALKERVELKGAQNVTDASRRFTKSNTPVEREVKEQNKEKGKEQVEPSMSDMDQTNGGGHAVRTSMPLRRSLRNKPDVKSNGTDADILSPALKERVELKGAQNVTDASRSFTKSITPVEREVKEQNRERENEQAEPSVSARGQTNGGTRAVRSSMPLRNFGCNKPDSRSNSNSDVLEARIEKGVLNGDNCRDASNTSTKPSTTAEREVQKQNKEKWKKEVEPNVSARDQTSGGGHPVHTSMPLGTSPHNTAKNNGTNPDVSSPALNVRIEKEAEDGGNSRMDASKTCTKSSTAVKREVIKLNREKGKEQVGSSGSVRDKDVATGSVNVDTCPNHSPLTTSGAPLTPGSKLAFPSGAAENLYGYPDSEFHDFDRFRTRKNFHRGQIWAMYSELDTYPKYYGWIRKVEDEPFKVHVNWLEARPCLDVEKGWLDANLPISCGNFKFTNEKMIYNNCDYFSHMVTVCITGKYCEILPKVGEIWAVYKNWSAGWTLHDLETCEFDIVQIRKQRKSSIEVLPMRKVPQYRSVFMPEQVDGGGSDTWKIPAVKYMMFSHRIPAIRLTAEDGGTLRGFWELDPASVPYTFFNRDK